MMEQYHKIPTLFKRDPETKYKTLLDEYATPELDFLRDSHWIWTEKVDGTNIRIMINPLHCSIRTPDITFGGKTERAQLPAELVNNLSAKYHPMNTQLCLDFPDGACLYGEGYGAKIQKGGGNYRPDQSFVMFDIKVGDTWLTRKSVEEIGEKYEIDVVPIYGYGTLSEMEAVVEKGFSSNWGPFPAEGLIAKPLIELQDRMGRRIVTKLKAKDFRRQHGEKEEEGRVLA